MTYWNGWIWCLLSCTWVYVCRQFLRQLIVAIFVCSSPATDGEFFPIYAVLKTCLDDTHYLEFWFLSLSFHHVKWSLTAKVWNQITMQNDYKFRCCVLHCCENRKVTFVKLWLHLCLLFLLKCYLISLAINSSDDLLTYFRNTELQWTTGFWLHSCTGPHWIRLAGCCFSGNRKLFDLYSVLYFLSLWIQLKCLLQDMKLLHVYTVEYKK